MQKRGMEMAINTLVVLILGIVILVSGMAFMYKLFDDVKDLPKEVDKSTEQQLFNILLTSKKRIAALYNVQTVKWKEDAIFPIAVQNQLAGTTASFSIEDVTLTADPEGATLDCDGSEEGPSAEDKEKCPIVSYYEDIYELKRYDSKAFLVSVYVPRGADNGEYTFTVSIRTDACAAEAEINNACPNPYAKTKIHVNVE